MDSNAQMAAIIGGCVAGGVVLIAIIAVILYTCGCCRKRGGSGGRGRGRGDKYPQLSPSPDSSHSQHSSISHVGDPRLPKVSSNGLWVEARGLYAASPSPAYAYSRPHSAAFSRPPDLAFPPPHQGVARASSETGLHLQPGVHGPVGYQGRMIYHSQQQLAPVYEMVDSRTGLMDVYQYDLSHSRSRLIDPRGSLDTRERRHRSGERGSEPGGRGKVRRSQSDRRASGGEEGRRPSRQKRRDPPQHPQHPQHRQAERGPRDKYEEARQKSKSSDSLPRAGGAYDNKGFQATPPPGPLKAGAVLPPAASSSSYSAATDSMKLHQQQQQQQQHQQHQQHQQQHQQQVQQVRDAGLDRAPPSLPNVTDDQKRVVSPAAPPLETRRYGDRPPPAPGLPLLLPPLASAPGPRSSSSSSSGHQDPSSSRAPASMEERKSGDSNSGGPAHPLSPAFPEASDSRPRQGVPYPPPAPPPPPPPPSQPPEPVLPPAMTAAPSPRVGGSSGAEAAGKLDVSGDDTDAGSIDLGVAGKHVTTAAFKFLDSYLSDEEGGEFGVESPPLSPKLQTRDKAMEF